MPTRVVMLTAAGLALGGPAWTPIAYADDGPARPWRPKLRNRHVSVAAMKRHARKRRNVRARQSKRS
jgi:hypothetical protein